VTVAVGIRVDAETSKAVANIKEIGSAAKSTASTVQSAGRTASTGVDAVSASSGSASSNVAKFAISAGKLAKIMAGTGLLVYAQQFLPISDNALQLVTIFGSLAVGIGKQLNLFNKLGAATQALGARLMQTAVAQRIATVAQAALNAVTAAFPIILIIVAIAAVIAALVLLYMKVGWFRAAVQAVMQAVVIAFVASWNAIRTAALAVVGFFTILVGAIRGVLAPVVGVISGPFKAAWAVVVAYVRLEIAILIGIFRVLMAAIRGSLSVVVAVVTAPFKVAFSILRGIVQVAIAVLTGHFSSIPGIISGALGGVVSAMTAPFRAAWSAIEGIFRAGIGAITGIIDTIKGIVSAGINVVKTAWNAFANVWNAIQLTVPGVTIPFTHKKIGGFTVGLPDVPTLAMGGVVDRATLAIIGEGSSREIVTPEPLLRAIVAEHRGANVTINVRVNVPPTANPADTGRQVVRTLRAYVRANGPIEGLTA
jgi:phage-related protein